MPAVLSNSLLVYLFQQYRIKMNFTYFILYKRSPQQNAQKKKLHIGVKCTAFTFKNVLKYTYKHASKPRLSGDRRFGMSFLNLECFLTEENEDLL